MTFSNISTYLYIMVNWNIWNSIMATLLGLATLKIVHSKDWHWLRVPLFYNFSLYLQTFGCNGQLKFLNLILATTVGLVTLNICPLERTTPNLGYPVLHLFSYLQPFGYNGQLKNLKFNYGYSNWSGNPENTFIWRSNPNFRYPYVVIFCISNHLAIAGNCTFQYLFLATLVGQISMLIQPLKRPFSEFADNQ